MPLGGDLRIVLVVLWTSPQLLFADTLSGIDFNGSLALNDGPDGMYMGWPSDTSVGHISQGVVKRRRRRYVAFPEGSSFTCAVCATVGVVGSPSYTYLSYGLNWGMAYDLPNETSVLNHLNGVSTRREPVALIRRRNRRSLYKSIEKVLGSMGYNGRECVLRALCESKQFFSSSEKLGMVQELVRTIFSLPKTRLYAREIRENSDIEHYNRAYFTGDDEDCEEKYPCSFSLLELAMGRYSDPPDYYENNEEEESPNKETET